MVNTMLDQISNMNELIIKSAKGIEALEISTNAASNKNISVFRRTFDL